MTTTLERRVMTDLINLYKEFPCLWDNRQVLYSNKEARDQAYDVLLEKYRQLVEEATIVDLKRRIENMRTTFRREHKKVLLSRLNGDGREYSPQLWYYDLMTFLNEVMEFTQLEPQPRGNDESVKLEFDEESSSSFKRLLETPPQKRLKRKKSSAIYLEDHQERYEDIQHVEIDENEIVNQVNEHSTMNANGVTETEAFGTTVGLQLKELDPMQKIYAEKLISDVIYHARLHRLTFDSNLNI